MQAVPRHIGIIMDGNRTWARSHGLDPAQGYRAGCQAIIPVAREAARLGVSALTLYTFSVENWERPPAEIDAIFSAVTDMLADETPALAAAGIAIHMVGQRDGLPAALLDAFDTASAHAPAHPVTTIAFAMNYGGREDILQAVRAAVAKGDAGALTLADIECGLATSTLPPLDLVIRAAGQQRLSNFLLWQAAYAELAFDKLQWPDFGAADLERHVLDFAGRNRSFGR